ncbi:Pre-mRNA-splicing factor prp12 [Bienertia sinuspersici]
MSQILFLFIFIIFVFVSQLEARDLHRIRFRSPYLYPEGLTYDPLFQHFIVASSFNLLPNPTVNAVSDAGVTETLTLITSQLPPDSTILGLSVDHRHRRLLAAVNSPSSPYLASFNLRRSSLDLDFLSPLLPSTGIANDVAFDAIGNAYVTNSDKNFIWKVDQNGVASVLSNSTLFRKYPVNETSPYSYCGLNGIAYVTTKEYLLAVQSNTGKMFKVDAVDGTARTVILPEDLPLADGIAVRDDGVVVVVSMNSAWFLKSDDSWAQAVLIDKIALDKEGYATSVTVGGGGRVYVVYGYVQEVLKGISQEREWFRIEEIKIRSKREKEEQEESMLWPILLIGLGLGYFVFWKLQMSQFVNRMDRKRD